MGPSSAESKPYVALLSRLRPEPNWLSRERILAAIAAKCYAVLGSPLGGGFIRHGELVTLLFTALMALAQPAEAGTAHAAVALCTGFQTNYLALRDEYEENIEAAEEAYEDGDLLMAGFYLQRALDMQAELLDARTVWISCVKSMSPPGAL